MIVKLKDDSFINFAFKNILHFLNIILYEFLFVQLHTLYDNFK